MAIEIFGFLFKPEISIGDIAAVAALISSALIFWFGYNRTRKSEQIKIARELMDRIDTKRHEFDEYVEKNNISIGIYDSAPPPSVAPDLYYKFEIEPDKLDECAEYFLNVLNEIEYFIYLVDKHELEDENVLKYYVTKVYEAYVYSERIYKSTRMKMSQIGRGPIIEGSWDKISQSPWIKRHTYA